ncbi:MAG: di-trans,poly-cis-decaprenylcistransferase [Planctomycetes bacterium RBG_16_43_13]|nr:MAG: di-trans,poly-cis-decaprenylcistransferase [Planctomycetes bacterium RBG_16_43_13]
MSDDLTGVTIPRHIAIIMDGNGRWAEQHKMSRVNGHRRGAETVREITRECARLGVKRLTLYAFSQENWKRPKYEISYLMRLLKKYLANERKEFMDNNIVFTAIGRLGELSDGVNGELTKLVEMSKNNTGMTLCLALNYGGRAEIVDAARAMARDVLGGRCDLSKLDEGGFAKYLYASDADDPDLLIRTGGEMRVSNFLLWQISYAEIWVTPLFWPDFGKKELYDAIRDFSTRERRFGGLNSNGR